MISHESNELPFMMPSYRALASRPLEASGGHCPGCVPGFHHVRSKDLYNRTACDPSLQLRTSPAWLHTADAKGKIGFLTDQHAPCTCVYVQVPKKGAETRYVRPSQCLDKRHDVKGCSNDLHSKRHAAITDTGLEPAPVLPLELHCHAHTTVGPWNPHTAHGQPAPRSRPGPRQLRARDCPTVAQVPTQFVKPFVSFVVYGSRKTREFNFRLAKSPGSCSKLTVHCYTLADPSAKIPHRPFA